MTVRAQKRKKSFENIMGMRESALWVAPSIYPIHIKLYKQSSKTETRINMPSPCACEVVPAGIEFPICRQGSLSRSSMREEGNTKLNHHPAGIKQKKQKVILILRSATKRVLIVGSLKMLFPNPPQLSARFIIFLFKNEKKLSVKELFFFFFQLAIKELKRKSQPRRWGY